MINRLFCDSDRIRTCDRQIRNLLLYPAELRNPTKFSLAKVVNSRTLTNITSKIKNIFHIHQESFIFFDVTLDPSLKNLMDIPFDLITILGHTAAGKTRLAALFASKINAEIISADSRQVYRGMDIGTGKDLGDYCVEGEIIPYHLIDIRDPGYHYNVFEFQTDFYRAYENIRSKNKPIILCGGTGMYIDAVVNNYQMHTVPPNLELRAELEQLPHDKLITLLNNLNPALHNTTDTDNKKRTIRAIEISRYGKEKKQVNIPNFPIKNIIIGISYNRDIRRKRISERLKQRLPGMEQEVRNLINKGTSIDDLLFYGLEYKYMTLYVSGQLSYIEMVSNLETAIHQFAKRQMTWFRGMERKGANIFWINEELNETEKVNEIIRLCSTLPL